MGNSESSDVKSLANQETATYGSAVPSNLNFEVLRDDCLEKEVLFTDETFPFDAALPDDSLGLKIDWKRPHEISKIDGMSPKFISNGTSRFDLVQGYIGDCWLLAAVASFAEHNQLFEKVVPSDQTFEKDNGYCGIFRFNFYHYNKWVEVVIDDYLPTYGNKLLVLKSKEQNEFWSALLEKAYAKLNGGYNNLSGGLCADALTDLTAGIVETYKLREATALGTFRKVSTENLSEVMLRGNQRSALMCAGINATSSSEEVLSCGLATGHAYSVCDVQTVMCLGSMKTLIRVRNPWGNDVEWKGAWSDKSDNWSTIRNIDKKRLQMTDRDDGDFWIAIYDFALNFDELDICCLTPDSADDESLKHWEPLILNGKWINDESAGGRLKHEYEHRYMLNPQFPIEIKDSSVDADSTASLIVELTQMNGRMNGADFLSISFAIYKITSNDVIPVPSGFFLYNRRVGAMHYINQRTVVKRFELLSGTYLVIPSTWDYGEEAEFVLRIFSESERLRVEEENNNEPKQVQDKPEKETNAIHRMFSHFAGKDMKASAFDLQEGLNQLASDGQLYHFQLSCCKAMVSYMSIKDKEGRRRHAITYDEFILLLKFLKLWKKLFHMMDSDADGLLSSGEFDNALSILEYIPLQNGAEQNNLYETFADKSQGTRLSFSAFNECLLKLQLSIEIHKSSQNNDSTPTFDQWLTLISRTW